MHTFRLLHLLLMMAAQATGYATGRDAAAMAADIVRSGSVVLTGVAFEQGTAALRAESDVALHEVAALLAAHDEWRFEVQAHTDEADGAPANLALSEARARTIVAWLTDRGVDGARLVARGYGDTKRSTAADIVERRAANRRIQLKKLNEE